MSVARTPRPDSPARPGRGRELRGNWAGSDESRRWRLKAHGDGPANPKRTKQKSLAWTHHCGSITTRQPTARRPAVQSHASGPDFEAEANSPPGPTASTVKRPRPYPRTLTRTTSSFVASTFTWPGVSSMISVIRGSLSSCGWRPCPTTKSAEVCRRGAWRLLVRIIFEPWRLMGSAKCSQLPRDLLLLVCYMPLASAQPGAQR